MCYLSEPSNAVPQKRRKSKVQKVKAGPAPGLEQLSAAQDMVPEPEPLPNMEMRRNDDCPHCYLSPCVTTREHSFIGEGQQACDANSALRKDCYQKYWKVIGNLGGWTDERYVNKKGLIGQGRPGIVYHRRDIMPDCVLKQLRGLYPNLPTKSYMGHKWD